MHGNSIPITPSHPFYAELIKCLDVTAKVAVNPHFDYKFLVTDYNMLPVGGFLGFLYYGKTNPSKRLDKALTRRGLRHGKSPSDDVSIYTLPVLSMEATALVATAPATEIPAQRYDGVTAVDSVIERRAENALNSESLPQIKDVWQVYLYKRTPTIAELEAKGRGRPKKGLTA